MKRGPTPAELIRQRHLERRLERQRALHPNDPRRDDRLDWDEQRAENESPTNTVSEEAARAGRNHASNTLGCFREFVGQRVIGILFDALPLSRPDLARGSKTLIFEDGRGLHISSNGSYWIESADHVRQAVRRRERELSNVMDDLQEVTRLAAASENPRQESSHE